MLFYLGNKIDPVGFETGYFNQSPAIIGVSNKHISEIQNIDELRNLRNLRIVQR